MKSAINFIRTSRLIVLLPCLTVFFACQKQIEKPMQTGPSRSVSAGENEFSIVSNNITKTSTGFQFTGSIKGKNNLGQEFDIGEGQFDVTTGAGDVVTSFKGVGIAKFPNIGIFADIQKTFAWKLIKSHIEYETGKYYKEHYGTDIPLTDDRKYLHLQVFDESKDGPYHLRNIGNSIIYKFVDFYVDPSDPAIFLKTQFPLPGGGGGEEATDFLSKFWKKVGEKLGKTLSGVGEYADSPNLIFGISNQATFMSKPYKFTVSDAQAFKEQFGFNQFESLPSHLFFKVAGIPIPETVVLQMNGECFVHYPIKSITNPGSIVPNVKAMYQDALDFLNRKGTNGYMVSLNGSVDPGAKGIGLILGMLPNINKAVGMEIFNKDFNIDIMGSTLQYQIGTNTVPSFLRFGIETKMPVASNFWGEGIRKYMLEIPTPSSMPSTFNYFNVGPELDDISYYVESALRMRVPLYGEYDLARARLLINKTGVNISAKHTAPLGPLVLSGELKGKVSTEGFELAGVAEGNIELPGGVKLMANYLDVKLSSDSGVTLHGRTELPYGLGKGVMDGQLTTKGLTLKGKLNAGSVIDLGNGYTLPTANMEFSVSTNPAEGVQLKGNVTIPRVGMVAVSGKINSDDYYLTGKLVASQISFGSVSLPYGDGSISISKKNGVVFKGQFNFGASFGQANMEGNINATTIKLTGSLRNTVVIGGHSFNFANGKIVATNTGVQLSGSINLYVFSTAVSGAFYSANNFTLTGQTNYNGSLVRASIKVEVTPSKVNLTGTGSVYGPLGREIFRGTLAFYPNWSARSIRVCYINSLNVQLCMNL